MRKILAGAAGLLILGGSLPAFAQRTTGSIVGVVTDASGAVLPGTTVTIHGENIVGTQSAVSNDRGAYRFPTLPPGSYSVTFTLSGFATLRQDGVRVSLGGAQEVDATLKLSQMAEEVSVEGQAPVVDTVSSQVSTTYGREWVRNAPIARFSFFDLINAAPGVNQSTSAGTNNASSTVFGSASDENSYQLDGTDFTAPTTGEAWPYPNTDAIEEIEVLSLGAPAEYGNLQGAVFNVVTRQGTNAFHGDANVYFQTQGLTSSNTKNIILSDGVTFADGCPSDPTHIHCPYHRDKFNDLTLQLSGPILKDKLWFFASYQHQRNNESQPGTDPAFPTMDWTSRVFGKLNWQISTNHKLMVAYHDDYYNLPFPQTALTAPSSIQLEHGHNPSPNLTYTGILSDKTYVEARVSGFYGSDHADPLNGGPRSSTRFFNADTGQVTGGIYSWYDGNVWKTAGSVKVSHFADRFLGGSHDFKFGVQYSQGGSKYTTSVNEYVYSYTYNGQLLSYGYAQLPYTYGGNVRTVGLFADDTYKVGSRLSVSLGVRYDNSKAYIPALDFLNSTGQPTGQQSPALDNLYKWNVVSPRVGFNLKLTADGKTALKGHYGRYYRGIVTGEFSRTGPSIATRYRGTYDFTTGTLQNLQPFSRGGTQTIDSNYKDPYTDQFIVQLERQLIKNLGVSVNYVHKNGKDYAAWRDSTSTFVPVPYADTQGADASGQTITVQSLASDPGNRVFVLTTRPEMFTKVNAATFQITKAMSSHWQAVASAVWSRAEGRLPSSLGDPNAAQRSALRGIGARFGQDPNNFINTNGLLIEDRPWVGKLQLVYELPKGFLIGANFLHQSGRPWAREVLVSNLTNLQTRILAEPLNGSRRVPNQNVCDIRLQEEIGIGKGVKLALFGDLLNLFNDSANESIGDRLGTSSSFGQPTQFILPRRAMLGAKIEF
jgi:outer membrane receptor protein involved in Fe transport